MFQLSSLTNQKLFIYHTFIREFFYAFGKLGWGYLLMNGTSLITVIMGLFFYRFFSSHILLYFSRKYFSKLDSHLQAFVSIFVQSLFLISFFFATNNILFFMGTVFLSCLSEVFYWPLRNNLQRLTVNHTRLGSNVALTKNTKTVAIIFGYLISGVGLYFEPLITLIIASVGMLLSYIPLKHISILNLGRGKTDFTESFFNIKNKLKVLKSHFSITNYLLICLIAELINGIIPLLLIFYGATIIELGFILVGVQLFGIFFHYIIGKFEDKNVKSILNYSIIGLLIVFLLFSFLDTSYLSILLVLFTLLGIGIEIGITSKAQRIIKNNFSEYDGGYVLVWAGNLGRSFILPVIFTLYFFKDTISFHTLILLYGFLILLSIYWLNKKEHMGSGQ